MCISETYCGKNVNSANIMLILDTLKVMLAVLDV